MSDKKDQGFEDLNNQKKGGFEELDGQNNPVDPVLPQTPVADENLDPVAPVMPSEEVPASPADEWQEGEDVAPAEQSVTTGTQNISDLVNQEVEAQAVNEPAEVTAEELDAKIAALDLQKEIQQEDPQGVEPVVESPLEAEAQETEQNNLSEEVASLAVNAENNESFQEVGADMNDFVNEEFSDEQLDSELGGDGVKYAGFWRRAGAMILDNIITSIITAVIGIAMFFTMDLMAFMTDGTIALNIFTIVLFFLYFAILESGKKQATFGKRISGIKVIGRDGGKISFLRAFGRTFSKIISAIIVFIGFIMAGLTRKKQGLHDYIANTYVVVEAKSKFWKAFILLLIVSLGIAGFFYSFILKAVMQDAIQEMGKALYEDGMQIEVTVDDGQGNKGFVTLDDIVETKTIKPAIKFGESNLAKPKSADSKKAEPKEIDEKLVDLDKELKFKAMTSSDYEAALLSAKVTDPVDKHFGVGEFVNLGAVAVEQSTFFDGDEPKFWLKVKSAELPNLGGDNRALKIDLDYVLSKKGQNLYNRESSLESDFFSHINLHDRGGYLSGIRTVNLFPKVKEEFIAGVKGKVNLKLPLEVEEIEFTADDIGNSKTTKSGHKVTLEELGVSSFGSNGIAKFIFEGEEEFYVATIGLNADGRQLEGAGWSRGGKYLSQQFEGIPARVKFVVKDGTFEKTYPFLIGKEYSK